MTLEMEWPLMKYVYCVLYDYGWDGRTFEAVYAKRKDAEKHPHPQTLGYATVIEKRPVLTKPKNKTAH